MSLKRHLARFQAEWKPGGRPETALDSKKKARADEKPASTFSARAFGVAPLQIAQALIGFGAIAAFTRLMSPEEFGRYALALSVSMLAHTLAFTWAEAAAYRFFAASKSERRLKDHFATLLALSFALGAGALIATAALLLLIGVTSDIAALSAFAAGAAVFRFLARVTRETERASLAIGRYATAETLYLTLGFAAGVACLVTFDLGAAAPFAGLMLAGAVMFAIDAPRLFRRAQGGAPSLARATVYASYGAPLALAIAVDLGVQTLARIILSHQAGPAALGAYAAAFGLARPLDLIFMWAGATLLPFLMTTFETEGAEAARAKARTIFTTLALLALPGACGLALVAEPLAALLIGEGLSAHAAQALPWLAVAGLLQGFNVYYLSEAFQLTRRTGLRALLMLAPGAAQVALTLWLAPAHGATGAAAAAAGGALLGFALLALVGRYFLPLPLPLTALSRIALASAAMTIAIVAAPLPTGVLGLVSAVAIGAASYALAAFIFDVEGVRPRASALFQSLSARMRFPVHPSFTDPADVRVPR